MVVAVELDELLDVLTSCLTDAREPAHRHDVIPVGINKPIQRDARLGLPQTDRPNPGEESNRPGFILRKDSHSP
jgi:hypothetical protein